MSNASTAAGPALVSHIALAALQSILQALTVASAGFYLGKRGLMTKDGAKMISVVTMRVAIPCLLFSRILPSVNLELVAAVWPMLFMPIIFVSVGAILGKLVVLICKPPAEFINGTIAAAALGNSTGLPIVLLTVVKNQLGYIFGRPNTTVHGRVVSHVVDPVVFLGVYLLTYPIVQWVAGGLLLMPKPKPAPETINSSDSPDDGTAMGPPATSTPESTAVATHLDGATEGEQSCSPESYLLTAQMAPSMLAGSWRERARIQTVGLINDGRGEPAREAIRDGIELGLQPHSGGCMEAVVKAARGGCGPRAGKLKLFIKDRVLVPPVCGVLLGLLCSSFPPAYYLLCGGVYGERLPTGVACPAHGSVFGFLTNGISVLGDAAPALLLISLGNSLSKGPDYKALHVRANVGIVIAKMIVMPAFGLGFCLLLDKTLGDDGARVIGLRDPYDAVFYVAAVAVTATPTANTLVMMTELAGENRAAMSTAVFSQYLAAPIILTFTLTVSVFVLHQYG